MSATQESTAEEPLDQIGQRARGAIVAAKKHDMQSTNLWLAAGLSLIAAKKRVPHGQWMRWLLDQKISDRSARHAMQIASSADPHAEAAKVRSQNAESHREARAKPAGCPANLTDAPSNVVPITSRKRPPHYAELSPDGKRRVDELCMSIYNNEHPERLLTN